MTLAYRQIAIVLENLWIRLLNEALQASCNDLLTAPKRCISLEVKRFEEPPGFPQPDPTAGTIIHFNALCVATFFEKAVATEQSSRPEEITSERMFWINGGMARYNRAENRMEILARGEKVAIK